MAYRDSTSRCSAQSQRDRTEAKRLQIAPQALAHRAAV